MVGPRKGDRVDEWNEYMGSLLETDGDGNIVFEELELAFALGEFTSGQ